MVKRFLALAVLLVSLASIARAQQAEVMIQLNEQFFDALLDAVFKNTSPPEFPLADNGRKSDVQSSKTTAFRSFSAENQIVNRKSESFYCSETIKLQREIDGVRTSVRFRDGRIYAPIAFTGSYNPPFIGCVEFAGVAETNIELEYDAARQALIGRARVLNVNLSGAGGVGGSFLARLVQSSIDKKINPIQILQMDKVSFVVPIQNAGSLRMKAVGIKHEIAGGALNVRIVYEFQKAQ